MRHTDRIQKYLDGEMKDNELKRFREDLLKDPELVQELDLHRSLDEIIVSRDEERFRKKLNEAYKAYKIKFTGEEEFKPAWHKSKTVRYMLVFMSILLGLVIVFYFQGIRKESNQAIFNKFLVSYNKELTSRHLPSDIRKNNILERGVNLYLQSSYSEASQLFINFLYENPENTDAHFYNGLCYIYLNEFESAIASFDYVLRQPYNYYQEYAGWYLAMCYIRTNNSDIAKDILQEIAEEKGLFSTKAKKVLRKLH